MATTLTRLCLVLSVLLAVAATDVVHVHHRMRILGEDTPFTLKGTVQLTPDGPSYAPAERFRDELTGWAAAAETPNALYEVALQTEGSPGDWPRSSVKLVSHAQYLSNALDLFPPVLRNRCQGGIPYYAQDAVRRRVRTRLSPQLSPKRRRLPVQVLAALHRQHRRPAQVPEPRAQVSCLAFFALQI
jgi:hypothetical protein